LSAYYWSYAKTVTASAGIKNEIEFHFLLLGGLMPQMNLRQLTPGQKASIVKITASGELGRRIRDMGLVPGMSLEVIGKAPLRDPVALRVEGSTIALRNSEADYVFVEVK
jgi:ferrous iron transport protein A